MIYLVIDDLVALIKGQYLADFYKLLRRSYFQSIPDLSPEQARLSAFGIEAGGIAAISLAGEDTETAPEMDTWLRADPVFLQADLTRVFLLNGDYEDLSDSESASLLETLKSLFSDYNLELVQANASRWYLRLQQPVDWDLPAPESVLGIDLADVLPEQKSFLLWKQLMTEAQTLLHDHPVNQNRIAEGKAPVNSLWFWGTGQLPESPGTVMASGLGNSSLFNGLCALSGAKKVDQINQQPDFPLAIEFNRPLKQGGSLDTDYRHLLVPALEAVKKGKHDLTVFASGLGVFKVSRSCFYAFWRNNKKLARALEAAS